MSQGSSPNVTMLHSKARNLCTRSSLFSYAVRVASFLWAHDKEKLEETHETLALSPQL